MEVQDIMVPEDELVTVDSDDSLQDAISDMYHKEIGCVVVTSSRVTGIVTKHDVIKAAYRDSRSFTQIPCKMYASSNLITIEPTATLEEAADKMEEHSIERLIVMDNGTAIGLIAASDLSASVPEYMQSVYESQD